MKQIEVEGFSVGAAFAQFQLVLRTTSTCRPQASKSPRMTSYICPEPQCPHLMPSGFVL